MTPWRARLAGWNMRRKLRRGQCRECGRPLRDDAEPYGVCAAEPCVAADWMARQG